MHNQDCLDYLNDHPTRSVAVRYSWTAELAFKAEASSVKILVSRGLAEPCWNKYGYLKYLGLVVSVAAARRAMRDASRPALPRRVISKSRPKDLRWECHYERSKSQGIIGILGPHHTLWVGPDKRP